MGLSNSVFCIWMSKSPSKFSTMSEGSSSKPTSILLERHIALKGTVQHVHQGALAVTVGGMEEREIPVDADLVVELVEKPVYVEGIDHHGHTGDGSDSIKRM